MERKFELRPLCSDDIFPMATVIGKIGFREFKGCFENLDIKGENVNLEKIGVSVFMDIGGIILKNLPSCKDEIYFLLASVSGLTQNEIAKLSIADFAELLIEFVQKPDFSDFFKVVSRLFKSEK